MDSLSNYSKLFVGRQAHPVICYQIDNRYIYPTGDDTLYINHFRDIAHNIKADRLIAVEYMIGTVYCIDTCFK